jgi:hypothetical protein
MTREKFIKKWLGNKDYQYTEQNRDLMRDDLDEVINQALRQPPVISSVCDCEPHTFYEWEKDENKCTQCSKPIYEQTDL